ncbi:MAG: TolC family protein [Blastocatellia bacterium]|nr:TolC family protein [Blastocatellia bacterium]
MKGIFFLGLCLLLAKPVCGQSLPSIPENPIPGIVTHPAARNMRTLLVNQPSIDMPQTPTGTGSRADELTLERFLTKVDQNHPKLMGANAERRIASAKRLEKQGAFDPALSFGTDFLRYNKIDDKGKAKAAEATDSDFSLDFLTRSGIKFSAGGRYNFGSVKSPLSNTGDGGEYFFLLKVPLWRDFRINEKSAAERQAKLGEPLADTAFTQTRLDLLQKAATQYWDWVAAKRKADVAKNLLDIAQIRAVAIRERADLGDLPPIDKVEAEQEVRRREGNLIKAERDLQKALFKLSQFLWEDDGQPSPLPERSLVPAFTPAPVPPVQTEIDEGRTRALVLRPELKSIQINREITQVEVDLAKNQRNPVVDLTFGPGRDTGFNGIGNTLKAGVSITIPLRTRTADGRLAVGQNKIQKLNFEEQQERRRISLEVEDALSAMVTAQQRYEAADQEFQLAKVLERGERDRFALGDSTLFLVNQRERATAEAASKLIEVQAEYEQAKAMFRAVTVQF